VRLDFVRDVTTRRADLTLQDQIPPP